LSSFHKLDGHITGIVLYLLGLWQFYHFHFLASYSNAVVGYIYWILFCICWLMNSFNLQLTAVTLFSQKYLLQCICIASVTELEGVVFRIV
jgi:hypothetical protein